MDTLIAFPVILVAIVLQTTIVSRLTLINGTADVVLLVVVAWSLQDGRGTPGSGQSLRVHWSVLCLPCLSWHL